MAELDKAPAWKAGVGSNPCAGSSPALSAIVPASSAGGQGILILICPVRGMAQLTWLSSRRSPVRPRYGTPAFTRWTETTFGRVFQWSGNPADNRATVVRVHPRPPVSPVPPVAGRTRQGDQAHLAGMQTGCRMPRGPRLGAGANSIQCGDRSSIGKSIRPWPEWLWVRSPPVTPPDRKEASDEV